MHSTITRSFLILAVFTLSTSAALAATTDGIFGSPGEYNYNTEAAPNSKHNTHNHGVANSEYDDGSGGDAWDINYLGTDIDRSGGSAFFQFGAVGGSILGGSNFQGNRELMLSDIAINVLTDGEAYVDPTINDSGSAGWDYAIRLLSLSDDPTLGVNQKQANFELFAFDNETDIDPETSSWAGRNIYGRAADGSEGHVTDTFELIDGDSLAKFTGIYTENGGENNVLEGAFDLGLLSLFTEATGGHIITYLTMSCVNDEAMVQAEVSAVPVPAAFWLFGSALVGFIGISRRTRV